MTFAGRIIRNLFHREDSERINAEISAALTNLKKTAAQTHQALQDRAVPNAALREALDRAKIMTTNFADFEKMIRRGQKSARYRKHNNT
jgi:hypothetical protein